MIFLRTFQKIVKASIKVLSLALEREVLGLDKQYIWISWETKSGRKTRVRIEAKRRES